MDCQPRADPILRWCQTGSDPSRIRRPSSSDLTRLESLGPRGTEGPSPEVVLPEYLMTPLGRGGCGRDRDDRQGDSAREIRHAGSLRKTVQGQKGERHLGIFRGEKREKQCYNGLNVILEREDAQKK